MVTIQQETQTRFISLGLVQAFELAVVALVGLFALLAERLPQELVLASLALLLLPRLVHWFAVGSITTPSLANVPLFALLLLAATTYWVTPSWEHTWPELVRMVWGVAVSLAVINWLQPQTVGNDSLNLEDRPLTTRLAGATVVFLSIGTLFTTIGLLGMQYTDKIESLYLVLVRLPRLYIPGVYSFNSNDVAGIIVLFVPLVLALALGPLQLRQRSLELWLMIKIPAIGLAFYLWSALLLTQTRGAWLAAAAAVVVMLLLLGRRGWLLLALLTMAAAGIIYAIGPMRLLNELTIHGADIAPGALVQDRNVAARMILWQRALHGIADAPLTGMGLAAFAVVSQQPYPEVAGFVPDPDMSHVHNIVLQLGVDLGVPGLVAFVSLLLIMGWLLVRLLRNTAAPSLLHTWSIGLVGSYVAYLVYNMGNATTLGAPPSVAVWFLFGLCIGAGEWLGLHSRKSSQDDETPSPIVAGPSRDWSEWEQRAWAATTRSKTE